MSGPLLLVNKINNIDPEHLNQIYLLSLVNTDY